MKVRSHVTPRLVPILAWVVYIAVTSILSGCDPFYYYRIEGRPYTGVGDPSACGTVDIAVTNIVGDIVIVLRPNLTHPLKAHLDSIKFLCDEVEHPLVQYVDGVVRAPHRDTALLEPASIRLAAQRLGLPPDCDSAIIVLAGAFYCGDSRLPVDTIRVDMRVETMGRPF